MAFYSMLFHTSGKKNPKISKNNLNKLKKFALLNYKLEVIMISMCFFFY